MLRILPTGWYVIIFLTLAAANILIYREVVTQQVLTATVFEIGKGTAVLLRAPSGKTLLIDTGNDASILRALGTALPMWQRSIGAILLTSDSSKSTGGLPFIKSRYHTGAEYRAGTLAIPYGAPLLFDKTILVTPGASGISAISYGTASFIISSSTSPGVYTFDGQTITKNT